MSKKPTASKLKTTIGWREWVGLPDLGVERIKAKVDTGARTSALHAWNVALEQTSDGDWVHFELHPLQRDDGTVIACRAPIADIREVRNSGGRKERRYVIRTALKLGEDVFPVEVGLANRDEMGFRLLIGREAVRGKAVVDPGRSFLLGRRRAVNNAGGPKGRKPGPHK